MFKVLNCFLVWKTITVWSSYLQTLISTFCSFLCYWKQRGAGPYSTELFFWMASSLILEMNGKKIFTSVWDGTSTMASDLWLSRMLFDKCCCKYYWLGICVTPAPILVTCGEYTDNGKIIPLCKVEMNHERIVPIRWVSIS